MAMLIKLFGLLLVILLAPILLPVAVAGLAFGVIAYVFVYATLAAMGAILWIFDR